jgi:hypothetical protein
VSEQGVCHTSDEKLDSQRVKSLHLVVHEWWRSWGKRHLVAKILRRREALFVVATLDEDERRIKGGALGWRQQK